MLKIDLKLKNSVSAQIKKPPQFRNEKLNSLDVHLDFAASVLAPKSSAKVTIVRLEDQTKEDTYIDLCEEESPVRNTEDQDMSATMTKKSEYQALRKLHQELGDDPMDVDEDENPHTNDDLAKADLPSGADDSVFLDASAPPLESSAQSEQDDMGTVVTPNELEVAGDDRTCNDERKNQRDNVASNDTSAAAMLEVSGEGHRRPPPDAHQNTEGSDDCILKSKSEEEETEEEIGSKDTMKEAIQMHAVESIAEDEKSTREEASNIIVIDDSDIETGEQKEKRSQKQHSQQILNTVVTETETTGLNISSEAVCGKGGEGSIKAVQSNNADPEHPEKRMQSSQAQNLTASSSSSLLFPDLKTKSALTPVKYKKKNRPSSSGISTPISTNQKDKGSHRAPLSSNKRKSRLRDHDDRSSTDENHERNNSNQESVSVDDHLHQHKRRTPAKVDKTLSAKQRRKVSSSSSSSTLPFAPSTPDRLAAAKSSLTSLHSLSSSISGQTDPPKSMPTSVPFTLDVLNERSDSTKVTHAESPPLSTKVNVVLTKLKSITSGEHESKNHDSIDEGALENHMKRPANGQYSHKSEDSTNEERDSSTSNIENKAGARISNSSNTKALERNSELCMESESRERVGVNQVLPQENVTDRKESNHSQNPLDKELNVGDSKGGRVSGNSSVASTSPTHTKDSPQDVRDDATDAAPFSTPIARGDCDIENDGVKQENPSETRELPAANEGVTKNAESPCHQNSQHCERSSVADSCLRSTEETEISLNEDEVEKEEGNEFQQKKTHEELNVVDNATVQNKFSNDLQESHYKLSLERKTIEIERTTMENEDFRSHVGSLLLSVRQLESEMDSERAASVKAAHGSAALVRSLEGKLEELQNDKVQSISETAQLRKALEEIQTKLKEVEDQKFIAQEQAKQLMTIAMKEKDDRTRLAAFAQTMSSQLSGAENEAFRLQSQLQDEMSRRESLERQALQVRNLVRMATEQCQAWEGHIYGVLRQFDHQVDAIDGRRSRVQEALARQRDAHANAERRAQALEEEIQNLRSLAHPRCVVCMHAPITVCYVPCGHRSVCSLCDPKLGACPVCRSGIRERVRTYDAGV